MSQKVGSKNNKVYRLVLTGGHNGGKTMGQARIASFFESLGWRVYRVPETMSIFKGSMDLAELDEETRMRFYENALKTMINVETTYFNMAASCQHNCLVVSDCGTMDISTYMSENDWHRLMKRTGFNNVDLRDSRYNQVVLMVSGLTERQDVVDSSQISGVTKGTQPVDQVDDAYCQAWVGHPYFDVIDNSTDLERKFVRLIACVCDHLGVEPGDRLSLDSKKRKFLIGSLPDRSVCPQFQDFIVAHDYLATPNHKMQARIRRRGQNGNWTYTHTIRQPNPDPDHTLNPELKIEINQREYDLLLAQKHPGHCTVYKKRRCFLWNNQYFQMDIYQEPCPQRCKGLILLETYTSLRGDDFPLPDFLDIVREVTDDPEYSMYNLSKIDPSTVEVKPSQQSESIGKDLQRHNGYLRDLKLKERYLEKVKQAADKSWASTDREKNILVSNPVMEIGIKKSRREEEDDVSLMVESLDMASDEKPKARINGCKRNYSEQNLYKNGLHKSTECYRSASSLIDVNNMSKLIDNLKWNNAIGDSFANALINGSAGSLLSDSECLSFDDKCSKCFSCDDKGARVSSLRSKEKLEGEDSCWNHPFVISSDGLSPPSISLKRTPHVPCK